MISLQNYHYSGTNKEIIYMQDMILLLHIQSKSSCRSRCFNIQNMFIHFIRRHSRKPNSEHISTLSNKTPRNQTGRACQLHLLPDTIFQNPTILGNNSHYYSLNNSFQGSFIPSLMDYACCKSSKSSGNPQLRKLVHIKIHSETV